MPTLYDMGGREKKEIVRSIRFEPELWEILCREAAQAHRTPAGQLRFYLEQELARRGLLDHSIAADKLEPYRVRGHPGQKKQGGS